MEQDSNNWTIYMYTFPNMRRYIGATTRSLVQRQGKEWRNYKRCKLLYEAIQEYGTESIIQTILFKGHITNEEASRLESIFIELFKTNVNKYNNPSFGYNQTDGGEGTSKKNLSEERKSELREQLLEYNKKRIGTHPSEETLRRLSESHMGQTRGIMPIDTRMKISKTNTSKEKHIPRKTKRAEQLSVSILMHIVETNKTLRFPSMSAVADYFGVNGKSTVSRWVSGKRRPPEGYIFIRESDYDKSLGWIIEEVNS